MDRSRREFLSYGAMCLAGLCARKGVAQALARSGAASEKPNIVYILLDALRADAVTGVRHGAELMPAVKRFSQQAVRFSTAMTPCTWTRPSMASIFTSLHVDVHQDYRGGDYLSDSFETITEYFKRAGYATAGIQTNANLAPEHGFARGFDRYDYLSGKPLCTTVTPLALERLQGLKPPFYFYIHYVDPHPPYCPEETYRKLLGYPKYLLPARERAVVEDFMPYLNDTVDYCLGVKPQREFAPLSDPAREAVRTLRDGKIREMDDTLATLFERLEADFPNTYIVVMADHGDLSWDHDNLGHGLTMWEPVLRVPFFLKGPGLEPCVVDRNVCTIDLLPTLAGLLGLPPNPIWQGRSLFDPRDPNEPIFSHTRGYKPPRVLDLDMVRIGDRKLIWDHTKDRVGLYDAGVDPGEMENLAFLCPDETATMKALLKEHRQRNFHLRGPGHVYTSPGVSS